MRGVRIVLAPIGSRGDVQPLLALAEALRTRGHHVWFCAPPDFAAPISARGFRLHACGMDVGSYLRRHAGAVVGRPSIAMLGGLGALRREVSEQFSALAAAARGADAIVGASIQFAGPSVAEALGIPYHIALFAPLIYDHRAQVPFICAHGAPRWAATLGWGIVRILANHLWRAAIDDERDRLGLPPIADVLDHVFPPGALLACDAQIGPAPDHSPCVQTGAWSLAGSGTLPAEVEAFLGAGEAPVFVGFGSMTDPHPLRTTTLILDAVTRLKARLVLSRGWANLGAGVTDPRCLVVGEVDHAALFPRVAAIVHHGGAGTVAAAARAGRPQVVVPHIADQGFWGHRLQCIGVAPAPISRWRLSIDRLVCALQECLTDAGMRARASALARSLSENRGVEAAVAVIESQRTRVTAHAQPAVRRVRSSEDIAGANERSRFQMPPLSASGG